MKKIYHLLLLTLALICINSTYSQVNQSEIINKNKKGKPTFIRFNKTKINNDIKSIDVFLKKQYGLDDNYTFKERANSKNQKLNSLESNKINVYYKNIKIDYLTLVTISKNNVLQKTLGFVPYITKLSTKPKLNEGAALNKALAYSNSKKYIWEDKRFEKLIKNKDQLKAKPKGKLVIIDKDLYDDEFEPMLAYKFNIFSTDPFSSSIYFINANNGELIKKVEKTNHLNSKLNSINHSLLFKPKIDTNTKTHMVFTVLSSGTAATRYSGSRTIETQLYNGSYRLRDYTRGSGIETYNARVVIDTVTNLGLNAVDFTDVNNNWTATEFDNTNKDNAGLDAHWGAMMTYDYFYQKHNRNGIDNNGQKILSYVNTDLVSVVNYINNENAFWADDIEAMVYGKGGSSFDPMTSIDIIAHEIGHALSDKAVGNGGLDSGHDPGAIDEGLSDIWGAMVKYFADPNKQTYLSGDEIYLSGNYWRSLINPNASVSPQPDTYQGYNWVYSG